MADLPEKNRRGQKGRANQKRILNFVKTRKLFV